MRALRTASAPFDREVVELNDRVRLRPEPDLPRVLERVVGPVEHLAAVVEDDEAIAGGLELQRVPGALGHLDVLASELAPAAARDVIDATVVLEGVATGDVVVVRVPVSPDEAEPLIDLSAERPRPHAEGDVLVGPLLEHRDGKAVIGLVGALLEQDMVGGASLLDTDDPLSLAAAARTARTMAHVLFSSTWRRRRATILSSPGCIIQTPITSVFPSERIPIEGSPSRMALTAAAAAASSAPSHEIRTWGTWF